MRINTALFRASVAAGYFLALAAGRKDGLLWSGTGGGWRSMAANSAYAQIFARIGLFEKTDAPKAKAKFDSIATNSGSSWFTAQFFFSKPYYNAVVDGSPASLGDFTQTWFEAYLSTQENITFTCPPQLKPICEFAGDLPPDSPISEIVALIPLFVYFDYKWANLCYAMLLAVSESYGDPNFVNVEASSANKLPQLKKTDLQFHTSLIPNMRAKMSNTITYLSKDVASPDSAYTTPLPLDWIVSDDKQGDRWIWGDADDDYEFPGGLVCPAPEVFVDSSAYENFPLFPEGYLGTPSSGLFTTPACNATDTIEPDNMAPPFGGIPTATQISTASSSTVGYLSEELPSYFAQFFSLLKFSDQSLSPLLDGFQNLLWETGLLANLATCSAWTKPNPEDFPDCGENNVWFTDGGYTDGPAALLAISNYQKANGIDGKIKLVVSNNNFITDNFNNFLGYFSTTWNGGVQPGDFIWAPGVGGGPVTNPWQSQQIFEEYLDNQTLVESLSPIEGTSLTMTVIDATTVDNPAFGVQAGQKVSIALLNINSNIPTFLVTAPVIEQYTPALVDLVETIAGSDELRYRLRAFLDVDDRPGSKAPKGSQGPKGSKGPKGTKAVKTLKKDKV